MSNQLEELRLHARIVAIIPDGDWTGIDVKFDHRNDVQGECNLSIWTTDARRYYIGQELCGIAGTEGPAGCLQIHASIEKISEPFNGVQWVELNLPLCPRDEIKGACRWRLRVAEAAHCSVGEEVHFVFTPVGARK